MKRMRLTAALLASSTAVALSLPLISGVYASGAAAAETPHAAAAASSSIPAQPVHRTTTIVTSRRHHDRVHVVRSGDTLSGLAVRLCGRANDWTGLYARNRALIGADPNLIFPGQALVIGRCVDPPSLLRLGRPAVAVHRTANHVTRHVRRYRCGDGDGDGFDRPCSTPHYATAHRGATATRASAPVSLGGMSSFEACVIARESGGDSQVMNASSHYGLFQFDYGTWVSGGGAGADFGHASVAEQQRVFNAVYAARGTQPWSPSDGC